MPKPPQDLRSLESLSEIVKDLRGPEGCPWDKEQTHRSLARFVIEEAHELAEAIDSGDLKHTIDELGDVLFQVFLHAELGRQSGKFVLADVVEAVSSKMVRRHPHVFSDQTVKDSSEVVANWNEIKANEKIGQPSNKSSFDIPASLPAILRSHKIGDKTKKVHFDWDTPEEVIEKIEEELEELKFALKKGTLAEQEHEIGDLLFSTVQLARHLNLDGEQCLRTTNQRFEKRFFKMKELVSEEGKDFSNLSAEEKESFWSHAKKILRS